MKETVSKEAIAKEAVASTGSDKTIFGRRDPDARGYFGVYGGRFVPETLVAPIEELTAGYFAARQDQATVSLRQGVLQGRRVIGLAVSLDAEIANR